MTTSSVATNIHRGKRWRTLSWGLWGVLAVLSTRPAQAQGTTSGASTQTSTTGALPAPDSTSAPAPQPTPSAVPDATSVPAADSTPAAESTPATEDAEEIVITTARKRRESVYDTPAALSVLGTEKIEGLNVSNVDDLAKYVPSLNITRFGVGNTSQAAVFIRGIGLQDHLITTDPGVGVYLDGIYLGRQMGNNLSLTNIERIEVLRGPQGTLYGRNTLGGAVNIVTRKPGDEEGVQVQLQGGTRGRLAANFYANFALHETFAVSATGGFKRRNGVGDAINLPNPEARIGEINEFSGRVAAQWKPVSSFRVLAAFDGMKAENGQSPSTIEVIGAPEPDQGLPQLRDSDIPDRDDTATNVEGLESTSNEAYGVSLTVEWDFVEDWAAKVLASFRDTQYTGGLDDDITIFNLSEFPEQGEAEQYSLELQVNGQAGPVDIVGGLYYFREEGSNFSGPFTFDPFNNANLEAGDFFRLRQKTDAFAAYANAGYRIIEPLSVGAGIRYSRDEKEGTALFPSFAGTEKTNTAEFDAITFDVNVTYSFDKYITAYAQVQRGYQTGGFPPRPFGGPDQFNTFDEITALNYEVGFKGILFRNVTLLTSFFWTEYSDLAVPFSQPQAGGFVTIVENAASSRARGFEIEGSFGFGGFFLNPSVGYIDAEITNVDEGTLGIEEGASPPLTPRWTIGAAAGYVADLWDVGSLRIQADYSFRDKQFGQAVESDFEVLDARSLFGFNVKFSHLHDNWDLELYGENIFNEVYDQGRLNNPFHGFVGIVLSNDRSEFGLRFTKRFSL